ncbi:MAG: acyltransferase [Pseudomonadales bacterium]|nr:acyltransferase [Pseudomonadales bacterium]MCP5184446.1 acyltransferase [Pseudomonadales bacterium]
MAESVPRWQQRPEAGTRIGLRFLLWVAHRIGRPLLRGVLIPVSLYFLLVRAPERRASAAFLARAFGRPARWWEVWRHFRTFAFATADRFFFLTGRTAEIPVRFVVDERLDALLAGRTPGLFLSAHFGSFEAARVLGAEHGDIGLRIVLHKALNARLLSVLGSIAPDMDARIIDASTDSVRLGLAIADALRAGDWVGFLADRYRAGDRTVSCDFLGQPAEFPSGPYLIASAMRLPLVGVFCELRDDGYVVHCEVISEQVALPRGQRQQGVEALTREFARRLEAHALATPYAWFNFFDFWSAHHE